MMHRWITVCSVGNGLLEGGWGMIRRWIIVLCGQWIIQGWDSSAFTRISVEEKLKSVVDDHFRGFFFLRFIIIFNPKQSESVFVLSAFCRVMKLFLDARALHCCSGFQKWPRERYAGV